MTMSFRRPGTASPALAAVASRRVHFRVRVSIPSVWLEEIAEVSCARRCASLCVDTSEDLRPNLGILDRQNRTAKIILPKNFHKTFSEISPKMEHHHVTLGAIQEPPKRRLIRNLDGVVEGDVVHTRVYSECQKDDQRSSHLGSNQGYKIQSLRC